MCSELNGERVGFVLAAPPLVSLGHSSSAPSMKPPSVRHLLYSPLIAPSSPLMMPVPLAAYTRVPIDTHTHTATATATGAYTHTPTHTNEQQQTWTKHQPHNGHQQYAPMHSNGVSNEHTTLLSETPLFVHPNRHPKGLSPRSTTRSVLTHAICVVLFVSVLLLSPAFLFPSRTASSIHSMTSPMAPAISHTHSLQLNTRRPNTIHRCRCRWRTDSV